jgi:Mrp family chromosome partitioning ATPase
MQQFNQEERKIITLTSASSNEGQDFVSWQLASSLVRGANRVLLVDFDFRNPRMHQFLGCANEKGICEVMQGHTDLDSAVQILPSGMTFLSAGKWNDSVRGELTGEKISSLLQGLKQHFDYVVINTHPILTVAETYLVGQESDLVILAVQKFVSRLPLVTRAQEKLVSLESPIVGTIFVGGSGDECLC